MDHIKEDIRDVIHAVIKDGQLEEETLDWIMNLKTQDWEEKEKRYQEQITYLRDSLDDCIRRED